MRRRCWLLILAGLSYEAVLLFKTCPFSASRFNDVAMNRDASEAVSSKPSRRPSSSTKPCFVSIRVTPDEKASLEKDASGVSVSAYVRERLLGEDVKPGRTRSKPPIKDHIALARVLRALAQSSFKPDFDTVSADTDAGDVELSASAQISIAKAQADIAAMRRDLIIALGLKAGSP